MDKDGISTIEFQRLVQLSPDLICVAGMDGFFKHTNASWEAVLGYTQDELTSRPFIDFIHPEDHAKSDLELTKLGNGAKTLHFENRLIHKDTSIRYISWTASPLIDEQKIYAIGRDITERKLSAEKLQTSEDKFRSLMKQSPIAIQIHSVDGKLAQSNQALAELYGFSEDTMSALYESYNILEDNQAKQLGVMPYIEKTFAGEITFFPPFEYSGLETTTNLHIDNQKARKNWIQVKGFPLKGHAGEITDVVFMAEDVTDSKRSEDALSNSEKQFRNLVEQSPYSIQIFAVDGELLQANEAFRKLWGLSKEELNDVVKKYNPLKDQELEKSGLMPLVKKAFRGEIVTLPLIEYDAPKAMQDLGLDHIDTNKRWIKVKFYPVKNVKGEITNIVDIEEDVTEAVVAKAEQEKLRASLSQAQKMEAIGTLAGGIAHDFNNILGIILGYADLIKNHVPPNSLAEKGLNNIVSAACRADDLVQRILAFSRQSELAPKALNPAPIIEEAIKLLRSSIPSSIELKANIDPHCGVILADSTQIYQIIMNLCTNAYQAMEETGGQIDVELTTIDIPEKTHKTQVELSEGKYLVLSVTDNGPGISQEIIDKIFDPYFTTKEVGKGTGLGLSILRKIIVDLEGSIYAETELDTGTTFNVLLPLISEDIETIENEHTIMPTGTERILFVDDEDALIDMSKDLLEALGYIVTTSNNSEEALKIFEKKPDAFDLIITDQTMPKLTGVNLAKRIMEIEPDIPIILCTGFSSQLNKEKALSVGIKDFIAKPIRKIDIAKSIRKALDN